MIICICRGKNDRDVRKAIDNGATSVRDFQRCGIGDQCGSCHNTLRGMLAQAATDACQSCSASSLWSGGPLHENAVIDSPP